METFNACISHRPAINEPAVKERAVKKHACRELGAGTQGACSPGPYSTGAGSVQGGAYNQGTCLPGPGSLRESNLQSGSLLARSILVGSSQGTRKQDAKDKMVLFLADREGSGEWPGGRTGQDAGLARRKDWLGGRLGPAKEQQEGPGGSFIHMEGPGGERAPGPWRAHQNIWKDLEVEGHLDLDLENRKKPACRQLGACSQGP